MTKQLRVLFSYSVSNSLNKLMLSTIILASFKSAHLNAQTSSSSQPNVIIQYMGTINQAPVFQVKFDNSNKEVFDISIVDEGGVYLYNQTVKDISFSKKFLIDIPDIEKVKLMVNIASRKGKQKQTFLISCEVLTRRNMHVSKL